MPASKSDLASRASMVTGLSCPAAASTSALSRRNSPIAASYSRRRRAGQPLLYLVPATAVQERLSRPVVPSAVAAAWASVA